MATSGAGSSLFSGQLFSPTSVGLQQQAALQSQQQAMIGGFNPLNNVLNMALSPTLGSLGGSGSSSLFGDAGNFGPNWMSSIVNSASMIGMGAADPYTASLVPQNGFTGVSALGGGSNQIAFKYMLEMLAKKDPDTPEYDKLAEKLVNMAGGSPQALELIAQQRLNSFDKQISDLSSIRASFPNGTQDAVDIDNKIAMYQAKRNNVLINLTLDQVVPANSSDARTKMLRQTMDQFGAVQPGSAEEAQLQQRVLSLSGNNQQLASRLIQLAQQKGSNDRLVGAYNQRYNPQQAAPGLSLGNLDMSNPLAAFMQIFMTMFSGASAGTSDKSSGVNRLQTNADGTVSL